MKGDKMVDFMEAGIYDLKIKIQTELNQAKSDESEMSSQWLSLFI